MLLGFNSYAELSLASKMAPNVEAVGALLEELRRASFDAAAGRAKAFAAKGAKESSDLKHWDISFGQSASEENCLQCGRTLLPPQVLDGLFPCETPVWRCHNCCRSSSTVWHEDVRHFQIADETGKQSPTLFGSLQSPRSGGVDGYCIGRAKITHETARPPYRKPVAYLV